MIRFNHFALAVLIIPAFGARNAAPSDRELIQQARRQQNAAIARHDYDAVAQRWTEDITIRAGLGTAVSGRKTYRDAFAGDTGVTYVREPSEVTVSAKWPLAYERGRWTGTIKGSQLPATISGEYTAQWVKRGGEWLIRSEIFVALSCTGQAYSWPAAP